MALVNYSDSDSDDEHAHAPPPPKKRRISSVGKDLLPPLPSSFLDQYSSTVRTSTQDDPSLHGGRARVTPHVEGNWPAHVYLEWHPEPTEQELLSKLIAVPPHGDDNAISTPETVHSLLHNDLGVSLPLHVSLSRPLVLKTAQREPFTTRLKLDVHERGAKAFTARPEDLVWHPNENSTRWFLVFRLQRAPELSTLLAVCNGVAGEFDQPLLYTSKRGAKGIGDVEGDEMHVSIAWSLQAPAPLPNSNAATQEERNLTREDEGVPFKLLDQLRALDIGFEEIKVRIGQDVHVVPLKPGRGSAT